MENDFRFLIYKAEEEDVSGDANVKDESIWLSQKGMAELFGVQVPAISKHLKNIFEDGELKEEVDYVESLIAEEKERLTTGPERSGKNYLLSHADENMREFLEDVRLGKVKDPWKK